MSNYFRYKPSSFSFDSDLAVERRRADRSISGVDYREEPSSIGKWERIRISTEEAARSIGRPIGSYDTLTLPSIEGLDPVSVDDAKNEVARELCMLFDAAKVYPERLLIVGLGNRELTPDAIGPECARLIEPTMHLKQIDEQMFYSLDCAEIAVIAPGVTSKSGIEASEIVRGVCDRIQPDAVIAIDSIASRSPERLGTTIQISGTGIFPGGGLGGNRSPIDEKTVGVPVFAIGVPTVISSTLLVSEDVESRNGKGLEDMFLSPKDINTVVKKGAEIIAGGINQAFGITY